MSRIVWHSGAPWAPTGYGSQTALFAPRIRDAGHDVALSATWGLNGAALEWDGMKVYPSDDTWGNTTLPAVAGKHQADLVVTLMDAWVLKPELFRTLNMACWVPVDHQPCPPNVARFFRASGAKPVAMSRFGEQMLKDDGLDPLYVPHGVDTAVYAPTPHDRGDVRESIGLPRDAFVVGMVANNHGHTPPRKAFPQAIMAFAELRRKHPDALLYLHSEATGTRGSGNNPGVNLPALCERFEIPASAVGFAPQLELEIGIPQESMAALYSSMDVLLSPSYGEGFGIPIVEAQACGTPVIVTDWTAMPELCGAGWKVGGEPWYDVQHGAFYMCPFVGDIAQALEEAYDGAAGLREEARKFALQYDADRITAEHWLPALERLLRPREVGALPNRAYRRAAKKKGVAA